MSEPEIARRCPSCGASIRDIAFFCPQCGNGLPLQDNQTQDLAPRPEREIARSCPSCGASIRDIAFFCPQCGKDLSQQKDNQTQDLMPQRTTEPLTQKADMLSDQKVAPRKEAGKEPRNMGQAALGAVGAKIQRATTLARGVEGDVINRVQKVREISNVVIDEAGYDPSLRFVLVAAILFILFLVIVLLNKLIV